MVIHVAGYTESHLAHDLQVRGVVWSAGILGFLCYEGHAGWPAWELEHQVCLASYKQLSITALFRPSVSRWPIFCRRTDVLYDKAAEAFRPLSVKEKHELMMKLSKSIPLFKGSNRWIQVKGQYRSSSGSSFTDLASMLISLCILPLIGNMEISVLKMAKFPTPRCC